MEGLEKVPNPLSGLGTVNAISYSGKFSRQKGFAKVSKLEFLQNKYFEFKKLVGRQCP